MALTTINAEMFRKMVIAAANSLEHNKEIINDLNVFPVPDGDTGTNMSLTVVSAVTEVNNSTATTVGPLAKAMGNGALRGARGNSGVITSQLFRGFTKAIPVTKEEIDVKDFADAVNKGVESAYRAVMKPKEGTILTVAKAMADEALVQAEKNADINTFLDAILAKGQEALSRTPEQLPVLKEAGVVDAGGAGLITIYQGFRMAINGETVFDELNLEIAGNEAAAETETLVPDKHYSYLIKYALTDFNNEINVADRLRRKVTRHGDEKTLVIVDDSEMIRLSMYTNEPDRVLAEGLALGQLSRISIDNMDKPLKNIAIIAVCAGKGLGDILKDYNVDELVSGGQSMNPSTEDILKAIENAPSNNIIILPNNKNIILAAEQAGDLTNKTVSVVPSRSFPQGLAALLNYNEEESAEVNVENMKNSLKDVKSGLITTAVRDSKIVGSDFEVREGEYIGLSEDEIVSHGDDIAAALDSLLDTIVDEDDSVISLYYGDGVTEEEANAFAEELEEKYDDFDIEVLKGGQPVYQFIISVE